MSSAIFDSYAFVNKLKEAGMPEEQAKILADEHRDLIDERLSTKKDIVELDKKIETSKVEIIKWVAGLLIAQAALVATLLKLFSI